MKLGELLLSKGLVNEDHLRIALRVQRLTGEMLGETLVRLGFLSPQDLSQCLAEQHGLPYIDLRQGINIPEELLRRFPREVTAQAGFLPLEEDGELSIVITEPANLVAIDAAQGRTDKPVKVFLTDKEGFWDVFEKAYYFLENPTEALVERANSRAPFGVPTDLIPQLVDALIAEGVRRRATDVHIMVTEPVLSVLYRVDGILEYGFSLQRSLAPAIVSRIKVLADMDIAEQRLPQDGSFSFSFLGRDYEVRVSTVPTIQGESVVLRILFGGSSELYRLERLGFDGSLVDKLRDLIGKPHGIILCVGPTGSGKSTTLYAFLREVDRVKRSVITIEDPVEYRLNFAKQSQINEKIRYDFAFAGRNFMRHDPDIILLGEIRDEETARVAVRASITGHLVLSTLHANDAVSTIPRLLDLGADRFLLSTSLLASLSQRLVRRICPFCREARPPVEWEREYLARYGLSAEEVHYGKGCRLCKGSGYSGRMALGELMLVDDALRDLIYKGASIIELREAAVAAGMEPLVKDGLRKALMGLTTLEELRRVLG